MRDENMLRTILSRPLKVETYTDDTGVKMLLLFSPRFGTYIFMLSPVLCFGVAAGKTSEATMVGPFTFAHSNTKAAA
jgi:hypothetical protein